MLTHETIRLRRSQLNKSNFPSEAWFEKILQEYNMKGYLRNWCLLNKYFGDFVWRKHLLVVEIDGRDHKRKRIYDHERDSQLRRRGYEVYRIPSFSEIEAEKIINLIKARIYKKNFEDYRNSENLIRCKNLSKKEKKQVRENPNSLALNDLQKRQEDFKIALLKRRASTRKGKK